MINLLPPEDKRQILAGQSNVLLLRYCVASLLLTIPLISLVVGIYLVLMNSKTAAEATIAESSIKSAAYAKTKVDAQEFKNNLATAKTILDKEVRYSKIAVAIAQAIPSGISLQNLDLNAQTFGQPIVLTATGHSYGDAIRLKSSLEDADGQFTDVHLQSITQQEGDTGTAVDITVSLVIDPKAAKL